MSVKRLSVPELVGRALEGDRRAIGRMLTLIERGGESADEITDLTHPAANGAHVVGITGAPGAGQSTLTGQLIRHLPTIGLKPAVLAVDPSSPLTGGAILGDRVRMDDVAGDVVHPHPVAEDRATGERRRGIDGEHGGLQADGGEVADELTGEGRLAGAGCAGDADDVGAVGSRVGEVGDLVGRLATPFDQGEHSADGATVTLERTPHQFGDRQPLDAHDVRFVRRPRPALPRRPLRPGHPDRGSQRHRRPRGRECQPRG